MTSRLAALPSELIDHILDQLDQSFPLESQPSYHARLKTLTAVSWTSKWLRASVIPHLYRVYWVGGHVKPIRLFLRRLCEQHDLTRHVEDLQLAVNPQSTRKPTSEDQELFDAALRSLAGTKGLFQLQFALSQGCHVAESILVFALTSRVQTVRLALAPPKMVIADAEMCKHCPIMNDWIAKILSPSCPISYPALQSAELSGRPAIDTVGATYIEDTLLPHIMRASHLTSLKLNGYRQIGSGWEEWHGLSNVSQLIITACDLDADSLAHIIEHCKSLTLCKIDWNHHWRDNARDFVVKVDGARLSTALLNKHQSTLQTLYLTASAKSGTMFKSQPAIHNLHAFSALHTLEIDEHLLADAADPWLRELKSDLPPLLCHLTIHIHFNIDRPHSALDRLGDLTLALKDRCPTTLAVLTLTFAIAVNDARIVSHLKELEARRSEFAADRRWTFQLGSRDDGNPCIECVVERREKLGIAGALEGLVKTVDDRGLERAMDEITLGPG